MHSCINYNAIALTHVCDMHAYMPIINCQINQHIVHKPDTDISCNKQATLTLSIVMLNTAHPAESN